MSRIVRIAGVSLLAVLLLGACTSDGGASGPEKQVIAQAEEICLDTQDKVGETLGDDPAADRDAIREATDKLMAIKAPTQNLQAWTLFVQSTNNLWISLEDVAQSLLPEVNDTARANRARTTVADLNEKVKQYASDYNMEDCARGYGRERRRS